MKKFVVIGLGIVIVVVVGVIYSQRSDKSVFEQVLKPAPIESLKVKNKAPEFVGINQWLNSEPLTMEQLKGKVVLIDFWTYSCINCIRTLPYVTGWYEKYKDKGLVIIGVHTPEFAFEKETKNVEDALKRFNITYPVAQDNNYATWSAYDNHYWPAHYLIDQEGNIVDTHFGEGAYEETEKKIQQLLGASDMPLAENTETTNFSGIKTPEIYLGLSRLENYGGNENPVSNKPTLYSLPNKLGSNNFALEGTWVFADEDLSLTKDSGIIKLNFSSGNVYMVAESEKPVEVEIWVDGKQNGKVMVDSSKLYSLFESSEYGNHTLELRIPKSGFKIFTFTFG